MRLLNRKQGIVDGQTGNTAVPPSEPPQEQAAPPPDPATERSGSRAHLAPSFRRITSVGCNPLTMRRSGSIVRPTNRVA